MAKFRTNHPPGSRMGSCIFIRVMILAGLLMGLWWFFATFSGFSGRGEEVAFMPSDTTDDRSFYLPVSTTGEVIHHDFFSLSYSEQHEQAEWTAHMLTRNRLEQPWHERPDRFERDPAVRGGSAAWADYLHSGYDRGHLVPAADMAWNEKAIRETFLMSNIAPQAHDFNQGIWRELEELARDWAKKYRKLYVITGPILHQSVKGTIEKGHITIPGAYYKILLDLAEPEQKAIAFLIPNRISYEPLYNYVVSIDSLESLTGIDFFPELMTDALEDSLERSVNVDLWPFSRQKFRERTDQWNQAE